jgi:hypothetical protein
MADLTLTAMTTPSNLITYTTRDGTPYRGDDGNIVQARPEHVADLQALGFVTATASQVDPGTPLSFDVGWAEDPAAASIEQ